MRHTPDYVLDDVETVRALVRENPWGTIVSFVPGRGLVASHYPLLLEEDAEGIVLVSHADPIKIALAGFLGAPLDFYDRLEIALGSISVVALGDGGAKVLGVNETVPVAVGVG